MEMAEQQDKLHSSRTVMARARESEFEAARMADDAQQTPVHGSAAIADKYRSMRETAAALAAAAANACEKARVARWEAADRVADLDAEADRLQAQPAANNVDLTSESDEDLAPHLRAQEKVRELEAAT